MNIATSVVILYFVITIIQYIEMFWSKDSLNKHKNINKRLEELRDKSYKTIAEQKEFTALKYPKKDKFKFTTKNVSIYILRLIIVVGILFTLRKLWSLYIPFTFTIWQAILIFLLFPIIANYILKKFGLGQNNILDFFRVGGK